MKHGIICPAAYTGMFAVKSDFHLILPHLYDNETYFNFYKERAAAGDFVVQDNSIFELEVSMDYKHLLQVAEDIGASEMVGPEVLGDAKGTKDLMEEFLAYKESKESKIPVMGVIQGSSIDELVKMFFEYNRDPRITTLGLPFDLEDQVPQFAHIRSLTLRRVLSRWLLVEVLHAAAAGTPIKPTHLMGLADAVELQTYGAYSWVRSNDSSSAFVHGINNVRYSDKGLPGEKIAAKLDFGMTDELTEVQIENVNHNIAAIMGFIAE